MRGGLFALATRGKKGKGNREKGKGVAAAAHSVGMTGNDLSVSLMADSSPERGAKADALCPSWLPFQGSCHAKRD